MYPAAASPRRPRADPHYHRWTPNTRSHEEPKRETHRKGGYPQGALDAPTAHQEKERQRGAMTKDHRLYHRRRAAAVTKTIAVEVVATVDNSGSVVGQETRTRADPAAPTLGAATNPPAAVPAVPLVPALPAVVGALPSPAALPVQSPVRNALNEIVSAQPAPPAPASPLLPPAVPVPAVPTLPQVPAMPTAAIPVVPSVPPFPTDLTVPGYPYASVVPAVTSQVSSGSVIPSLSQISVPGSSAIPTPASSIPLVSSNSTMISTSSSSSLSSTASHTTRSSAFSSMSGSDTARVSVAAFTRSFSSESKTATSYFSSITTSSSAAGSIFYGGGGDGGAVASTAPNPALATAGADGSSDGSTTPLQTPQVVGSVVGSLAGAALILAIILLLLRRHKRQRRGALQLTNDETTERSPPPMAQNASAGYRIPSAFLNRFSAISRSTVETSTSAGEKSFQRVSGRKLPSAFSEGMTSEQFARGTTLSGSSFYTDDQGTYGGPGASKEFGREAGATPVNPGMMSFRPGPARTPIIRHPSEENVNPFDDPPPLQRIGSHFSSHLSPPQSPNPDAPRSTLGRSLQSQDGSRSSRFTENV